MLTPTPLVDQGVIDSQASSHMTAFRIKFPHYYSMHIVDGSSSPVVCNGVVCITTSFILKYVMFVPIPKFHVSVLSISQIIKH